MHRWITVLRPDSRGQLLLFPYFLDASELNYIDRKFARELERLLGTF
jgi:hypothetical protein